MDSFAGYELHYNKNVGDVKELNGVLVDVVQDDFVSSPLTYHGNIDVNLSSCESNYFYLVALGETNSPFSEPFCLGSTCSN